MTTTTRRLICAVAIASMSTLGCGAGVRSLIRDAPHEAVPGVADESLNVLEDAGTRRRMAAITETPEMQETLRGVGDALVTGGIEAMSSEETIIQLRNAIERFFASLGPVFEQSMNELARNATRSFVQELSTGEAKLALRGVAEEMARGVVSATRTAVEQVEEDRKAAGTSLITRLERALWVSIVAAFALGMVCIALLAWALALRKSTSRYRAIRKRRTSRPTRLSDAHAT